MPEAARRRDEIVFDTFRTLHQGQHLVDAGFEFARPSEASGAEVDPHHRVTRIPVPGAVGGESRKQLPTSLEELLRRVEQQALAEPARARKEVVGASLHQLQ